MTRRWFGPMAVAAALALAAAGCGGDNKPSSSGTGSGSGSGSGSASGTAASSGSTVSLPGKVNDHGSTTVKDGASLEMELDDYYFGPTFITGPAGAKVTVELKNEGTKNHTFTIDAAKVDQQLSPDKTASVQVTLPASGTLAFYCKFHQSQGMQGAFESA